LYHPFSFSMVFYNLEVAVLVSAFLTYEPIKPFDLLTTTRILT